MENSMYKKTKTLFSPQVLKAAKFQGLTADLAPWFYGSI